MSNDLSFNELYIQELKKITEALQDGRMRLEDVIDCLAREYAWGIQFAKEYESLRERLAGYDFARALVEDNANNWKSKEAIFRHFQRSNSVEGIVMKAIDAGRIGIGKQGRASRPSDALKDQEKELVKAKYFEMRQRLGKEPPASQVANAMRTQCKAITCSDQMVSRWIRNGWRKEYETTLVVK